MAWTVPPVTNVGDIATSSFNNLYVKDNTLYLRGDTTWTAPTLATNWGNFATGGYSAAGYRKIGDKVVTRGLLTPNTTGAVAGGTVMFTFGSGYRPTGKIRVNGSLSNGVAHIDIDSAGQCIYAGVAAGTALAATTADIVSISSVTFSTL